jgi:hypothetical protein
MYILGVFGPWQVMVLLCLVALPIVLILVLVNSRAKHKGKAEALDSVITKSNSEQKSEEPDTTKVLDQLEKLNKLRESGALTQEEFNAQKAKLL